MFYELKTIFTQFPIDLNVFTVNVKVIYILCCFCGLLETKTYILSIIYIDYCNFMKNENITFLTIPIYKLEIHFIMNALTILILISN